MLRLTAATSMLGHGLVRLPKLTMFSNWMVGQFHKSILPAALVQPFSYMLPIAEFAIGLLLIFGLFTRISLIAGSMVMIALIFGSCLTESWDAIVPQMIHGAFFAFLLQYIGSNRFSLDRLLGVDATTKQCPD